MLPTLCWASLGQERSHRKEAWGALPVIQGKTPSLGSSRLLHSQVMGINLTPCLDLRVE